MVTLRYCVEVYDFMKSNSLITGKEGVQYDVANSRPSDRQTYYMPAVDAAVRKTQRFLKSPSQKVSMIINFKHRTAIDHKILIIPLCVLVTDDSNLLSRC